jgi:DNA-binding NarL/FixJ family response regulator
MNNHIKISIIEGDPIYTNLVESLLQKIGYPVVTKYTSGEEAIKKMAKSMPALLIIAMDLPGKFDGVTTAKEVLSRYNVPSVFLSSSADEEALERVKTVPGAGIILKPFNDNSLRIAIGLCLANFESIHQFREENAQLRRLVEDTPAGIIVTNSKGLITYVNDTAKMMLKWKNPLLNTSIFNEVVSIVDIREGRPIEDPFTRIMAMKAVWWLPPHAALISHDHTKLPIAGNVSPICDDNGSVTGMIAILFPVSEFNYLQYRGKAQF